MGERVAQLTFDLGIEAPAATMADFVPAPSNEAARQWLAHTETWPLRRLALNGPAGSGKTHLARAWAGPCPTLDGATLAVPAAPPGAPRLVIDNADAAPADALLHWINLCAGQNCALLLVARPLAARFPYTLPDLVSRLRATSAVGIAPPEDALLSALFARALSLRQMRVAPEVQAWLLAHLPRNQAAILEAVAALDAASLRSQARITRGFARATLVAMLSADDGPDDAQPVPRPTMSSP